MTRTTLLLLPNLLAGLWMVGCGEGTADTDVEERGGREPNGGRDGDDDDDANGNAGGGGGNAGGGADVSCYEQGYVDCYNYYAPSYEFWGCTDNADFQDYMEGFCDCEYVYYGYCYYTY